MSSELTVVPVVDYEPPVGTPHRILSPIALHRRPRRLAAVPPVQDHSSARAAAMFADAVLRGVLEVVDGRRSFAQLRPLLADGIADSIITLARSSHSGGGLAAKLRRVQLRIVDADGDAAEVFATYCRGDRVRAIAGRIECAEVRGRRRWRLVALHVG
ncbi:MAG TPA: Rv3235 family protein [Mycobacterium sp.]|nr:Rv3235 family protein [Mycobacterium sp.]